MQPTKRKGSNRKKEAKPPSKENQVKISNFLIKSIVNPTSNESEDPEETKTTSASEYQSDLQVGTRSPAQKTDDRPIRGVWLRVMTSKSTKRVAPEVIVIESSPYIHRSSPIPSESHRGSPPMSSLKQLHVRTTTPTNPPKTVHPFFAPRVKKMVISPIEVSPITPNRAIHVQYSSALWPDRENIHCGYETAPRGRPADSIYHNRPRPVKKTSRVSSKSRRRGEFGTVDELTEQPFNRVPLETYSDREVAVDHIEEKYRSHPALSRLISDEPLELPQYQLWNDKFSPRRKADILHNTDQAEYLYGWMKALEIQVEGEGKALGSKPPQVVIQRAVDKRRKRRRLSDDSDDIEDFIADDDDDEGANDDESMWDEDGNESEINDLLSISEDLPIAATTASSTLSSREPSPFPTFQLSNLGTRSRPSARKIINSSPVASLPVPLVGESPKKIFKDTQILPSLTERLANTIILHGPAGSGKTATIYACAEELHWKIFEFYPGLGKRSGAGFMLEMGGTGDNHRVGGLVTQEVRERDTRPSPSLGFLASPSKKARNPPSQMSEQPSTQSSDVHQSLVLIEEGDIMFQSDNISVPYETNLAAFSNWPHRPAVMPELVIGTEDGHFRRSAPQEDLETLIHLSELVDSISFSDAFIDRRLKDSLQEGSIDRYRSSSDDTQGHTLLCKVEEPEEAVFTSALRPREDDMALWVAYHARVRFEQRGHGQIARRDIGTPLGLTTLPQASIGLSAQAASLNMTELAMDRAKYQAKVVHALDEGISLQSPLLPSPGCILDYMPWMREIARGAQGKLGWMSPEGRNVLIGDGLVSP
ncbi:hypothetical protein FRC20_006649 [Serendipita sp. 405]|nr:hypothetical protein FRC20_006649 [Serendipita sp. 405]